MTDPFSPGAAPVQAISAKLGFGRLAVFFGLFGGIVPAVYADVTLVPAGAIWKYLDNGQSPEGWKNSDFNDGAWASGPAELGYNTDNTELPEATVISYGGNANAKYITSYFRHSFNIANPVAFNSLKLRLVRDDGAVVYLNGVELIRSNMPTGTITPTTPAPVAVGGTDESKFFEFSLGNALTAGVNVIAVEVHQQAASSSDVSFNLELIGLDGAPTLTRGPYLQNAASSPAPAPASAISIRWRTSIPTSSKVWWGTASDLLTETAEIPGPTIEHEVRIPTLLPNQQYFYGIGSAGGLLASGPDYRFTTPPVPGGTQPFRVWVLGDSGTANANAAAVRNAYTAFTGNNYTNMWLMLGDNAYNNGTEAEFQAAVFDMYPAMLRQSPLWSTLGNHDHYTSAGSAYFNQHTFPIHGEAGGAASGTEKYYSFDYGNVHFICLDSMSSDRSKTGPMAVWLQSDLESTLQDWIIGFWHHPPYTFGSHNSDNVNNADGELVQMRENFLPLLEAGGVDLVMGGHSHSYERSYLINGHYGNSTTFSPSMKKATGDGREVSGVGAYAKPAGLTANQGAVYATAGSSGKATNWWGGSTAEVNPNPHPVMVTSLLKMGSMVLDFNNTRLDVKFLTSTGLINDQFTINKTVPNQRPTVAVSTPVTNTIVDAPVAIAATAEDADGSVTRVDFYAGTTLIGSSGSRVEGTFQMVWTGAPPGVHTLTAEAWDNLGTYTVSVPVNITVNAPVNQAPTVTLTSPTDGSVYTAPATVTLSGTAADSDGTIASVSIYDDSALVGRAAYASGSWTFSWPPLAKAYNLTAVAVDNGGATATTAPIRITVNPEPIPAAPLNLAAAAGDARITLTWTASSGATSYTVKRAAVSSGPFALVASGVTTTNYINSGLVNETTYYYVVSAKGDSGESSDSFVVGATPVAPMVLTAPTNLTARAPSSTQINLTWAEASSNEAGFKIERSLSSTNSTFTEIGTAGPNALTYQDTAGIKANTTYYYRVKSYSGTSSSAYSNKRSIKTPR